MPGMLTTGPLALSDDSAGAVAGAETAADSVPGSAALKGSAVAGEDDIASSGFTAARILCPRPFDPTCTGYYM